jgi:hypothetical protein|tara:strand:+ start:3433 stop:4353 length:921 start_codon:yes stop_codon:yes gene_type:complete
MSVKSIGYRATSGRGGKYVVPNITVNSGGQIESLEVSDIPQLVIATGLAGIKDTLADQKTELSGYTSVYEAETLQLATIQTEYDKVQTNIDALETKVNTLLTDINADLPSQVVLNYSSNSVPYGLTLALNGAPWFRAGPVDYSYAAPSLGNYVRSILYDYPIATSGLYHIRVSLTLTQQRSGTADVNGVSYTAAAMKGAANQVGFVYIFVDGVLHSVMNSCCWDYYSTQLYVNGAKFLNLTSGQKLSVGIMFVSDISETLDIPTKQIAFMWNLEGSTSYVEPDTNVNSTTAGNPVLKLTFINGLVS